MFRMRLRRIKQSCSNASASFCFPLSSESINDASFVKTLRRDISFSSSCMELSSFAVTSIDMLSRQKESWLLTSRYSDDIVSLVDDDRAFLHVEWKRAADEGVHDVVVGEKHHLASESDFSVTAEEVGTAPLLHSQIIQVFDIKRALLGNRRVSVILFAMKDALSK